MQGYVSNIEKITEENENFRQVLYTAKFSQLVAMSLKPKEEIGEEIHDVDQFFRIEAGAGLAVLGGQEHKIGNGDAVIVPAGLKHNIINTSASEPLKLYTLYCPPHHQDQIVHATKEQALADDEHFAGQTTE